MIIVFQIVTAALLSGLVATVISIWYRDRYEARNAKLRLFQQLLGSRHVLLPGPHDVAIAADFLGAVNQIFLMFHDAPSVLSALKAFHEAIAEQTLSAQLRTERLLELFKSMAKHLKINTELLGEGFFLKAFSINSFLAPQFLDFTFQAVQLQEGQPVIVGNLPLANGHKMPFFLPVEQARNIGCVLIEFAILARERGSDLRKDISINLGELGPDFPPKLQRRMANNA